MVCVTNKNMHLDENITSSGQLVWQQSSRGCYIVACNVDTRRQEIEMRDNRRGGTSPVWDMYVSAAWARTGNQTALGNVCANVVLAAGKVRNTIQGGDFLFESKTTIKNPAVPEVFGELGAFFINTSLYLGLFPPWQVHIFLFWLFLTLHNKEQ